MLAALGRPDAIESGRFGYRLNIEPDSVDASRFELLVDDARSRIASSEPEQARPLLRAGLELFTGQPLADAAGAYVESAQARLTQAHLAAIEDLAESWCTFGPNSSPPISCRWCVSTRCGSGCAAG